MTDGEKAAFLYGFGIGMKCVNPGDEAFTVAQRAMLPMDRLLAILVRLRPEVEDLLSEVSIDASRAENNN